MLQLALYPYISDVTVVTSIRNVPGSKWRLLSNVLARVGKTGETAANWNNSRPWIGLFQGAKCDNVPKCNLEFVWGKSVVVAVTPLSRFHIILFLLTIFPTEFLRTSSAWHRTPTGPSHTWRCVDISEPLGTQRWWHFDLYSVQGNEKFVPPMYKHTPMPPFCYGAVYMCVPSREASHTLQHSRTFFNVIHMQHLVAKPRIAS